MTAGDRVTYDCPPERVVYLWRGALVRKAEARRRVLDQAVRRVVRHYWQISGPRGMLQDALHENWSVDLVRAEFARLWAESPH